MKTHSVKFNFIMNSIFTVCSILFPLITFPYISRVLLVERSGTVSFAISVITYFTMFATLGLPTYGVRACAIVRDDREKLSQTVQELLVISGITTAVTYVVFFILLFAVPQFAAEKPLLMVSALSIGLSTIGVQWFYNALEQYSYITTCAIIFKLIGIVLMFLLVKQPEDYVVYGFVYVVGSFGSYVLNFIRLRKFISFRKTGKYELKKHLRATLRFFLLSAASSVYLNLDVVMLRFMQGDTEVGYYNAAIKVKTVLVSCVTSLGTVLLPRLSYYIEKGETDAYEKMVQKAFNFVFVAATALTIYFMIFAEESILFLAGEAFSPATVPMILLMPTVLLIGTSNITGFQMLTPVGEEIKVVYSVAAGAVLDFVFNLFLIPHFGASGAAAATLMAEALVLIVQLVYLRDSVWGMLRATQYWKIGTAVVSGAAGSCAVKIFTDFGAFPTLFLSAIVFFGIYGIILLILKEKFVSEILESVFGTVKKIKGNR